MLDLASVQYIIENRGKPAQSHKSGGLQFHVEPPVAR
jgi:hypothetical protein